MRSRALLALTTATLALTAVAVPAAHAHDGPAAVPAPGEPQITDVSANGGQELVVGLTRKNFDVTFTATDDSGIAYGQGFAWWADAGSLYRMLVPYGVQPICTDVNATTAACATRNIADPNHPDDRRDLTNELAGRWDVYAVAQARDGGGAQNPQATTVTFKREAKLSVDASPEPAGPGDVLTVTGSLTRADWDANKFRGFASSAVNLEYRKKGTDTWTTVKTVQADAQGKLKTSVNASEDGYYRYVYAGSRTTGAVTSAADFVDVI
ncbi:calcium-binding protein [Streptomyces sp. NPDC127068]|uniref:calcium-binding protein n=1 Tax=Streptomyces sp. NPDC127068 TaxID=3347127 RepID=UPI00364E61C1